MGEDNSIDSDSSDSSAEAPSGGQFNQKIDKVLSKQVQIVDSSGQTYIIQGGNQDIMDAIQGNYRIVLVFGGRTNGSSINRLIQRLLRPPNPG